MESKAKAGGESRIGGTGHESTARNRESAAAATREGAAGDLDLGGGGAVLGRSAPLRSEIGRAHV